MIFHLGVPPYSAVLAKSQVQTIFVERLLSKVKGGGIDCVCIYSVELYKLTHAPPSDNIAWHTVQSFLG